MAIAKWIDSKGKQRIIKFEHNGDNSWDNLAWEMANAYDQKVLCHRKGDPALYALFKELADNARINYPVTPTINTKEHAFEQCEYRNSIEKPVKQSDGSYYMRKSRVGYQFNDKIMLDCDTKNLDIIRNTAKFYSAMFNSGYTIIQTGNGHWIRFHKLYSDIKQWRYDLSRVLYPSLEYNDTGTYIKSLHDVVNKASIDNKDKFVPCGKTLRDSLMCCPVGDVDITHIYLALKYDKITIRASKKFKDEIIKVVEEVII